MMVMEMIKEGMDEDVGIIGGLIVLQFLYAGQAVLLKYVMSLGLPSLTIIIFTSISTFLVLFPLAVYFERTKWPHKFSFKFVVQILLLSLGGVTLFQSFFLKGIKLTSPTMGTAMPNLAPGLIFIIAWTFRLEKINIRCTYSRVKILGTLICVVGAFTMSIMQSISSSASKTEVESHLSSPPSAPIFDTHKIIGCLYLMIAIVVLSGNVVLQAFTLGDFPAPISLCAITSLFGAFMTAMAQLLEEHKLRTGWPLLSVAELIGYSVMGGAVNGLCLSFNGWAMKKKGPVLVSIFSPICTVCSIFLSVATLGDTINIGSLAGMFLMFMGLYFVLWAKGKEGFGDGDGLETQCDAEKPLLS